MRRIWRSSATIVYCCWKSPTPQAQGALRRGRAPSSANEVIFELTYPAVQGGVADFTAWQKLNQQP